MSASSLSELFQRPAPAEREAPRFLPEEGWLPIGLLLVIVLSTIWSIDQAHWVEGTGVLIPIALAGILSGLVLARTKLAGWIGVLLGLTLGAVICFVVIGQLLPPFSDMPRLLGETLSDTVRWVGHPAGLPPLLGAFWQFFTNAWEFGGRFGAWMVVGATGQASSDNSIFLLLIAFVAWVQGLIGAWGLFRLHDVVVAALPTGIALATNAAYTGQARGPFAIFFISLLLLAVSLNLSSLQKRWDRLSVDYPSGLLFDVTVSSFVVICILAILAVIGPRLSDNPISNAFWNYMGEQWGEVENASNRLFSGVNSPQSGGSGAGRDRLVLSGPVHLSQRVVMQVQSDEPYYWRGATYDTWTGHDWLASDKLPLSRTEKQPIFPQRFTGRKHVKVTFEIDQSRSDLIYVPDEPEQISIPYKEYTHGADTVNTDYSALHAKKPAIPSLKYSVDALTSIASVEDLRGAPPDVPDWVKRYTQLPDVPQRVRDLSNSLTRGRKTNYDKAVAIEQYLRRFPYTLDVKAPPAGQDAVEYFLFDLKQGYCDYLASSMVVLLRAQGIPARLATGYVAGKFDNNAHKFIVTEEEAHSWPEVYFPNFGWMAFEPSGYRPPIVRPEQSVAATGGDFTDCNSYDEFGTCSDEGDMSDLSGILPAGQNTGPIIGVAAPRSALTWRRVALPGTGVLVLGALGAWFFTRLNTGRQEPTRNVVRRVYRRMTFYGAAFGMRRKPSETPLEYARSLTVGLHRTIEGEGTGATLRLKQLVGSPNGAAEQIASSYVRTMYGQQELTEAERERVIEGWKELRWRMPLLLLRDRRN